MTSSPPQTRNSGSRSLLWLVSALTFASVLLLGYQFGEVNHNEQLPLVLRALDANYLRNDWVVNANQGFNHRSFYTALMALASRVLGVEAAFFFIYLASLLAWTSGISALVRSIWPDDEIAPVAAVFAPLLLLFSPWGTISNTLIFTNLIPALPSLALTVWFGVMLRRGKLKVAALLLLASGLLHAQIGPLSGVFLLVAQIYALGENRDERRHLLRHFPLWVVGIALPLGLALISDDKRALTALQSREALDVLTFLRHPHHYVPASWTQGAWRAEIAWLLLILVARQIAKPSRFLDGLLVAALVFCASGWLPFALESLFPLVKLQHFRMSIWLQIAGSLYLSRVVALWWNDEAKPRRVAAALLFSAFVMPFVANSGGAYRLLLPLCLGAFFLSSRRAHWPSLLLLLPWIPFWVPGRADSAHFGLKIVTTALFALLTLALLRLWRRRPQSALRVHRGAAILSALALFALFLRPPTGRLARFNRVQTRLDYEKSNGPMELWVKDNTPPDAVFLIPLTLEDFRLKAHRAVVVDYKVFPWSDAGLLDWRRRIDAVLGAPLPLNQYKPAVLDAHYANLGAAQVETLDRRYGANYFLTSIQSADNFKEFEKVYDDRKWYIFRLR